MARRIQLPSSSELFDDPAPRPGRAAHENPRAGRRPANTPAVPRGQRPRSPRRPSAALTRRISQVEGRLGDLPIDTLLDLRDGLESVLAGDMIDEKQLAALLALGR